MSSGLVLNTNINSLVAQNALTSSGTQLSQALEQLSTGLRINTAADDAAGYAIVNGMTSQINGLNQASQNANDGVSLSQTASGALSEIVNDLQSMRDLAVESLNATNSSADRDDLDAQFQQLKADIDNVASTTQFNGVNLLDGSFQGATFQVGANAGQTITMTSVASAASNNLGQLYTAAATDPTAYTSTGAAGGTAVANGDTGTFTLTIGSKSYTTSPVTLTGTQSTDLTTIAAAITQATGDVGVVATVDANGTGINLSSTTQQSVSVSYAGTTGAETLATFGLNATSNLTAIQAYSATGSAVNGDTLSAGTDYIATGGTVTDGVTTAGTGTYTININGTTYSTGAINFDGTAATDLSTIANALNNSSNASGLHGTAYSASVSGGKLVITETGTSPFSVSGETFTAGTAVGTFAGGFATSVNATGTPADTGKVSITVGGNTYTTSTISGFDGNPYNDATLIANALNQSTTLDAGGKSLASQGFSVAVNAQNQLVVTGAGLTSADTVSASYAAVTGTDTIDLGLSNTATSAESAASSTTLADANVKTVDSSNEVLIQIDAALQQLATTGADLGAYQDRFQAAVTGLQTDATNLSSAKSGIQDTDYAQATSQLTQAQILQQAGTAMVAQANTIPQNVLTLINKLA